MSNFQGYLIKATATGTVFPETYIAYESYDSTPNQREEVKAVRDDYTRELTRITASGTKTSLSFSTTDLDLAAKMEIQTFFTEAETDKLQRKIQLTYWNDEDNEYKTSYFYRPDIKFTIKKHTDTDISYKAIDISLVEY